MAYVNLEPRIVHVGKRTMGLSENYILLLMCASDMWR